MHKFNMNITRARHDNRRQRLQYVVQAFFGIAEDLVTICTLGYFVTSWRAYALFELFEDKE